MMSDIHDLYKVNVILAFDSMGYFFEESRNPITKSLKISSKSS